MTTRVEGPRNAVPRAARPPFDCFVIGEGPVAARCAGLLVERGHQVRGVLAGDELLAGWAREHGAPVVTAEGLTPEALDFLRRVPFDYLFSIANRIILPATVLRLPRRAAINVHDALLPSYAGLNAPSWAIIGREQTHGITWHVMGERVDAGQILKQRVVAIDPDETAHFAELVDELAEGRVVGVPQDASRRTYYSGRRRPEAAGVIAWGRPAEDIDALVRGLQFALYPNPLAVSKVVIAGSFLAVHRLVVLPSKSHAPPGTMVRVEAESVWVATATRDVAITELATLWGQPLSIAEVVGRYGLAVGSRLDKLESDLAERITRMAEEVAEHEDFWAARLGQVAPVELSLARTGSGPARIERLAVQLPAEVESLIEGQDYELEPLLVAALAAYLARFADCDELALDLAVDRLDEEPAEVRALFAAHVPLQVQVDFSLPFDGLRRAVEDELRLIARRKTYPLDLVSRRPELLRMRESLERGLPVVVGRAVERLIGPQGPLLAMALRPDGPAEWLYDASRLSARDAQRMLRQFTAFLRGLADNPERPLTERPVMDDEEAHRVLVGWNATRRPYPLGQTVHGLFEAQTQRSPNAVAVRGRARPGGEEIQVSYAELNRRANQLAHHLGSMGAGPGTVVSLAAERSPEAIVQLLAILKTGAAYLPLDLSYPTDRLAFMVKDAGVRVLVADDAAAAEPIARPGVTVVSPERDADVIAAQPAANLEADITGEHPAYVIYTSGSTGVPKGVIGLHRGVVNRCWWMYEAVPFASEEVVGQTTALSFVDSVWEIFGPLLAGLSTAVLPTETVKDASALVEELARARVTRVVVVPSLLRALLDTQTDLATRLPHLRVWTCSGEELPLDLFQRFRAAMPHAVLLNLYGSSEVSADATWFDSRWVVEELHRVPIGKPIANAEVYVLDRRGCPVPPGAQGELYVGGAGLARGYLNRPELTAERFVPHPFSTERGACLYRTGDLARYRDDGNLEYLGRADRQIKVRGFRVEPGEVEAVLLAHDAVREGVVVGREDTAGDVRLVAYVALSDGHRVTSGELRGLVRERLPEFMVPSAFVVLEALPLTPNGKVDRQALPLPGGMDSDEYDAPRTPTEAKLAEIWRDVLGVDLVGVNDDLFDLGGHSLLAVRLLARVNQELEVALTLATLMRAPTIAAVARAIESTWQGGRDGGVDKGALQPGDRESRVVPRRRAREATGGQGRQSALARPLSAARARLKAALVVSSMVPSLVVRPLEWLAPEPRCVGVTFETGSGKAHANLYLPAGVGPHTGMIMLPGANPIGPDDPRLVRASSVFARAGFVVLAYWSPTLLHLPIEPDQTPALLAAFEYLEQRPEVDPECVGLFGACFAGSYALIAAADPRIAERAAFVTAFGAYYRRRDLVQAQRGPEARGLRGHETSVYRLLAWPTLEETDELLDELPTPFLARMERASPHGRLGALRARVVLMHAVADHIVPVEESRRLREALRDKVDVRYAEFELFDHVDPTRPVGVGTYLKDLARLTAQTAELTRYTC